MTPVGAALAQAAGYCSRPIWLAIIRPTDALCPPLISRTVAKSPITSVSTNTDPMAIPGLHSGTITCRTTAQGPAPLSTAAALSRGGLRIIVLEMGPTMHSV